MQLHPLQTAFIRPSPQDGYRARYCCCRSCSGSREGATTKNLPHVQPLKTPAGQIEYAQAVEALFSVSYTVKFIVKKSPHGVDYSVMPLEGLWWADDMSTFLEGRRDSWKWTMMLMQPPFVTKAKIDRAITKVGTKKKKVLGLPKAIHPRSERVGKHHEIYLCDMRKGKPENWKTVIHQPMR